MPRLAKEKLAADYTGLDLATYRSWVVVLPSSFSCLSCGGAFEAGRLGVPVDGAPAAPVIWRQVEVPTSITLKILHDITTLLNARRREAEIVGIDPLPKDVTPDLKTYLDTRAEPPAEAD